MNDKPAREWGDGLGLLLITAAAFGPGVVVAGAALALRYAFAAPSVQAGAVAGILLLALLSVGRAAVLGHVGRALLAGGEARVAIGHYATISAIQTCAWSILGLVVYPLPHGWTLAVSALLMAWPLTLVLFIAGSRRRLGVPPGSGATRGRDDDALGPLVALFGQASLVTWLGAFAMLHAASPAPSSFWGNDAWALVFFGMFAPMLLHVRAFDHYMKRGAATEFAGRLKHYRTASVIMTWTIAATVVMIALSRGHLEATWFDAAVVAGVAYALDAWPRTAHRYITARAAQPPLPPSDDRGLQTLGWALLGLGGIQAAASIGQLLVPADDHALAHGALALLHGGQAMPGLGLALGALTIWLALELLTCSPRRRVGMWLWWGASVASVIYNIQPIVRVFKGTPANLTPTLVLTSAGVMGVFFAAAITRRLVQRYRPTAPIDPAEVFS